MTHWLSDTKREDGVRIEPNPEDPDTFVVIGAVGQSISYCPCCGKTMTQRAARLVADIVYPVAKLAS